MSEIQQPPKLPSDPTPDINKMLANINQSKVPPEGQTSKTKQETEQFIGVLPPELQNSLRGFFRDVAKTIVSQEQRIENNQVRVPMSLDRIDYYKGRLAEVLDSGFLNPHISPPKKITE